MKTLALLLLSALATAVPAEEAKAPAKGPRIAVEPPSFDFGEVLQNRELKKEFSLRNFGSEDLVIQGVSTSCGCTVAALETKVLKPGASTPLRVKLKTPSAAGRIGKSVLIRSNDPEKETYELKVEATVGGER